MKKTKHGQYRAQEREYSNERIDEIMRNPSHKYYQLDGAEVFVKKTGRGKGYDIVIKGVGGVVTAIHADTRRALTNLARNYNWQTVKLNLGVEQNGKSI
jgi:hypothetical protein